MDPSSVVTLIAQPWGCEDFPVLWRCLLHIWTLPFSLYPHWQSLILSLGKCADTMVWSPPKEGDLEHTQKRPQHTVPLAVKPVSVSGPDVWAWVSEDSSPGRSQCHRQDVQEESHVGDEGEVGIRHLDFEGPKGWPASESRLFALCSFLEKWVGLKMWRCLRYLHVTLVSMGLGMLEHNKIIFLWLVERAWVPH